MISVGNIPYEATEEKLKDIFNEVGPVISFKYSANIHPLFYYYSLFTILFYFYFYVDWFMTEKQVNLKVMDSVSIKIKRLHSVLCVISMVMKLVDVLYVWTMHVQKSQGLKCNVSNISYNIIVIYGKSIIIIIYHFYLIQL